MNGQAGNIEGVVSCIVSDFIVPQSFLRFSSDFQGSSMMNEIPDPFLVLLPPRVEHFLRKSIADRRPRPPCFTKLQAGNFQGSSKCHMSIFDLEDFIIFRNAMDSTAPDVSTGVWISSNLRSHQRLRNPPHSLIQSTTESTLTLRYGH